MGFPHLSKTVPTFFHYRVLPDDFQSWYIKLPGAGNHYIPFKWEFANHQSIPWYSRDGWMCPRTLALLTSCLSFQWRCFQSWQHSGNCLPEAPASRRRVAGSCDHCGNLQGFGFKGSTEALWFWDLAGTLQKERVLYDVSLIQLAMHRKGAKPFEGICDELDCNPAGAFQQHILWCAVYTNVPCSFAQPIFGEIPKNLDIFFLIFSICQWTGQVGWSFHSPSWFLDPSHLTDRKGQDEKEPESTVPRIVWIARTHDQWHGWSWIRFFSA